MSGDTAPAAEPCGAPPRNRRLNPAVGGSSRDIESAGRASGNDDIEAEAGTRGDGGIESMRCAAGGTGTELAADTSAEASGSDCPSGPTSWASALAIAADWLASVPGADSAQARRDAEHLFCAAAGASRAALFAWPERVLEASLCSRYFGAVGRCARGEPLAYVLGSAPFLDFEVEVDARVLIPRPETELLVEQTLELTASGARIADLGTGSGVIAIALARAGRRVVASDRSTGALDVARENAARLSVDVEFRSGAWFEALAAESETTEVAADRRAGEASRARATPALAFDAIVSNPPYVAPNDGHLRHLRHEPHAALVAGDAGRADLARLVAEAPAWLAADGWLVLEHGFDQGAWLRRTLSAAGYRNIATCRDFAGHERVTRASRPVRSS